MKNTLLHYFLIFILLSGCYSGSDKNNKVEKGLAVGSNTVVIDLGIVPDLVVHSEPIFDVKIEDDGKVLIKRRRHTKYSNDITIYKNSMVLLDTAIIDKDSSIFIYDFKNSPKVLTYNYFQNSVNYPINYIREGYDGYVVRTKRAFYDFTFLPNDTLIEKLTEYRIIGDLQIKTIANAQKDTLYVPQIFQTVDGKEGPTNTWCNFDAEGNVINSNKNQSTPVRFKTYADAKDVIEQHKKVLERNQLTEYKTVSVKMLNDENH